VLHNPFDLVDHSFGFLLLPFDFFFEKPFFDRDILCRVSFGPVEARGPVRSVIWS
jgi:hypothetical protein